jgi:hypothetical protein
MITRRNEEEYQKHWKRCTSVRSPYMPEPLYHKTKFIDGTESYSEAFNPTLMDRYPRYDTDTNPDSFQIADPTFYVMTYILPLLLCLDHAIKTLLDLEFSL